MVRFPSTAVEGAIQTVDPVLTVCRRIGSDGCPSNLERSVRGNQGNRGGNCRNLQRYSDQAAQNAALVRRFGSRS